MPFFLFASGIKPVLAIKKTTTKRDKQNKTGLNRMSFEFRIKENNFQKNNVFVGRILEIRMKAGCPLRLYRLFYVHFFSAGHIEAGFSF